MGLFSSKKVELPPTPTFYRNPYVLDTISYGLNTGKSFITQDGSLSPSLREAISLQPQSTQYAIESAKSYLAPSLRDSRQSIISQLEANNQLTGSTTASSLQSLESDYLSQIQAAGLSAAMEDVNRALGARLTLAGLGSNMVGTAGQQALTDQGQTNDFNLQNYENEVAKTLAGQKPSSGGLIGALTGGLGGAMAGLALAPFTGGSSLLLAGLGGAAGAAAGGFGPQGTGGSLLTAGAGLKGGLSTPKTYSTVNPFTLASGSGETITDNLRLSGALGANGGFWGGLR